MQYLINLNYPSPLSSYEPILAM